MPSRLMVTAMERFETYGRLTGPHSPLHPGSERSGDDEEKYRRNENKKISGGAVDIFFTCTLDRLVAPCILLVLTCTCTVMSFLSIAFIAHILPVLVQSVLEHVHRRSLYYVLR